MLRKLKVSVDEEGNFLLPAQTRRLLHLTPGMTLVVEEGDQGALRLRVQSKETILGEKEGVWVARVKAWGDLTNVVRHERDRRVLDLLRQTGL